jgi:hypothetical protein
MTLIIPPGYALCSCQITHQSASRPAFITFGVKNELGSPMLLADGVFTSITRSGSIVAQMDQNVTVGPVTTREGISGGEPIVDVSGSGVPGQQTLTTLPSNCALLMHKRTARGGRRGRGRMFIPWCLNEPSVEENGQLTDLAMTAFTNVANTFLSALSEGQTPMYILHNTSEPGTDHPTSAGSPDLVTVLSVDRLIGTQRRRLGR